MRNVLNTYIQEKSLKGLLQVSQGFILVIVPLPLAKVCLVLIEGECVYGTKNICNYKTMAYTRKLVGNLEYSSQVCTFLS